ncbi:MAG: hypothetical protein OQJ97_14305 [Rhodospirillales bacterium]|nr:hypothetical protein [Rhodospirillales bacterium]
MAVPVLTGILNKAKRLNAAGCLLPCACTGWMAILITPSTPEFSHRLWLNAKAMLRDAQRQRREMVVRN